MLQEHPIALTIAALVAFGALVALAFKTRALRLSERRNLISADALQQRQNEFAAVKKIIEATEDLSLPLKDILTRMADILPEAFTYPDDAMVHIVADTCVIDRIASYDVSAQIEVPVVIQGQQRGWIRVAYRSAHPDIEEGPFWSNERILLDILSHRIGSIVARKEAAVFLKYTEEKFQAIFRNAAIPAAVDDGPRFTDVNLAAVRSFGLQSPADMIGKTPADFSPEFQPDGRRSADVVPEVVARLRGDGQARFDWTFRRADGTLFVAELTLSAVTFGGKFITLSTWADVTELRKAQTTLARYNETLAEEVARRTVDLTKLNSEFSAILSTATSGIALVRHMKVVRGNPALVTMFRTTEDRIISQSLGEWCEDEETWAGCSAMADKALWSGGVFFVEHELRRHDGTKFWARLSAKAVDHRYPEFGSVWVIEDISAEREAQVEMEKARALAEEAAEVKARFLANMSHEIRTPMNAIIGFARLLQDTNLAPRQRGYLQQITAAGESLLGIINEILDFSKVEAGKISLESIDLSLRDVAHGAVNLILSRATAKRLDIIIDIDPALPPVFRGDPLRLGQILSNLLSNAVKFTEKGEVILKVSGKKQEDESWSLAFDVIDTGIGMSPEQMSQLFQSFSQIDASNTRMFGGTGLGLVISKSLAELMGGTISVHSALGQGTTFTLDVSLSAAGTWQGPVQDAEGQKFIVFDGNARSAGALIRGLRARGARVVHATSLHEAKELFLTGTGAADGWTAVLVADPLSENKEDIDTMAARGRIILLTYPDEEGHISRSLRAVAKDVIHKPADAQAVLSLVKDWQEASEQETSPPPQATRTTSTTEWNVLLVEDNLFNQDLTKELLHRMGGRATLASNGAEAVEEVKHTLFDVVLMDLQMPVMGGLEATRAIRALEGERAKTPIIALTASIDPTVEKEAYDSGVNALLLKPFTPSVLEAAILRHAVSHHAPDTVETGKTVSGADRAVTPPDDLAALQQINAVRGLALAGGSVSLFRKLLARFAEDYAGFEGAHLATKTDSDPAAMARALHRLKSSAAQIGAEGLAETAGELEAALQADCVDAALEIVPKVVSQLRGVLAEIGPHGPETEHATGPNASSAQEGQGETFESAAARMIDLLDRGEFGALSVFESVKPALRKGFRADAWTAFSRAIQGLDLPAANLLLRKAMEQKNSANK